MTRSRSCSGGKVTVADPEKSGSPIAAPAAGETALPAGMVLRDYVALARPDHWTKNLFVLPGVVLAKAAFHLPWGELVLPFLLAILATCLVSSANYALNEWLDRHFDRFHPVKRGRASVRGQVRAVGVGIEYALLAIAGLGLAALVNGSVCAACAVLLVMGVVYNVEPLRTKDRPFLDVISESINNPIRLCIGWMIAAPLVVPPSSVLVGYWSGGAFLMAAKRYAEYRTLGHPELAGNYRKSFRFYSERTLLASMVFYAMAASLFLGVFLVKYRIELILTFPLIAGLFTWYVYMSMDEHSAAQHPEKLLSQRWFMTYVLFLSAVTIVLLLVDIPPLHALLRKTFSEL
jgi:decaprenyl-phosphate phosphoribosyltransferase